MRCGILRCTPIDVNWVNGRAAMWLFAQMQRPFAVFTEIAYIKKAPELPPRGFLRNAGKLTTISAFATDGNQTTDQRQSQTGIGSVDFWNGVRFFGLARFAGLFRLIAQERQEMADLIFDAMAGRKVFTGCEAG